MNTSPTFGHVIADALSFRDGVFCPINTAHGTLHPDAVQGTGKLDVTLSPLNPGEFFQVREEIDKSEGRRGTMAAGNFLNYGDAYRAAAGKEVQGGRGRIVIMTPAGTSNVTALDADGQKVIMASMQEFIAVALSSRLVFSQPWETDETSAL